MTNDDRLSTEELVEQLGVVLRQLRRPRTVAELTQVDQYAAMFGELRREAEALLEQIDQLERRDAASNGDDDTDAPETRFGENLMDGS